MSSETVWIKKRGPVGVGTTIHIHTDPDCQPLQQATEIRETTREKLPDHWPDCSLCAGTAATGGVPEGESTHTRRDRLEELDPDDL
ncbi:hypothetical protein [Haloarcula nitratireducens]|uniref:Uncharacterized protein n=1 Tax=Haloarcula nitratireducens TaxID=2487749 RepID=A0AAW4PHV6_9EURY|nr:hypothetical protein [Halomicroarcula nitratireducens]MBX0296855.1 hypothetical protein [Halomicroarcula nitratireducens]